MAKTASASPAKPANKAGVNTSPTAMLPRLPQPLRLPRGKARIVSSDRSFQGNIFSIFTEQVVEPNGVEARRDVVRHNGSVVILPVDDSRNPADPDVVLELQFRQAANQYLLELPAGRVDPGERPLAAAKRELIEETGFRARKWERLVRYYASPGFVAEWMEIYLATDLRAGSAQPEEDERIQTFAVPLSRLVAMIDAGEIHDGKTIVGTMVYQQRLRAAADTKLRGRRALK